MENKPKKKVIPCEVFTRVVGFMQPVKNFNKGKREEYKDRVTFKEDNFFTSKFRPNKTDQEIGVDPIETIKNDSKGIIYIGVNMCSACNDLSSDIKCDKIKGTYLKFNNPIQAGGYIKKICKESPSSLVFPFEIKRENLKEKFDYL